MSKEITLKPVFEEGTKPDFTVYAVIGQEWCVPDSFYMSGNSDGFVYPYNGHVAIKTGIGWLILCSAEKCMVSMKVRRRPIKREDLQTTSLLFD